MTFGLVDVGYSLPDGQAVKLIFFAPCFPIKYKRTKLVNLVNRQRFRGLHSSRSVFLRSALFEVCVFEVCVFEK